MRRNPAESAYTLLAILAVQAHHGDAKKLETQRFRARRFANGLERLIAPNGSYPTLGHSLCYRIATFLHTPIDLKKKG